MLLQASSMSRDFLHDNAVAARERPKSGHAKPRKTEPVPRHEEFGEVPTYLKVRQAEWAKEAEVKRKAAEDKDVPAGMRLMPDSERLETLELLKAGISETQAALSKFKLNVTVPSQVRRKAELENKMTQLEEAQRVFGKTRVFVKLDE
jgi:hypothetical protein